MLFSSASGLSTTIVSGMMFTTTIHAIGVPFGICMGTSFVLYSSTETRWLPILYSVKTGQMCVPLRRGGSSCPSGSVITFILVPHRTNWVHPLMIVLEWGGRYSILAVHKISSCDRRSGMPLLESHLWFLSCNSPSVRA